MILAFAPKLALFGLLSLFALLSLLVLLLWVRDGGQKAEHSVPETIDGPEFRTYEAVVADSPLRLKHFISQPEEINVSSSLIMGRENMICVTAQATKYAAERLADEIEATGLNLKYVYLDHAHFDHSQGAAVLSRRFPTAKFVGAPEVVRLQQIRMAADDKLARSRYGDNAAVPSIPFEPLEADKLTLEGREIMLWHNQFGDVGVGKPDEPHTVLYIPDLKALLPSDICYFGGHMMMGGSTQESRAKWKEQIRRWMDMDLEIVIPGHILRSWSPEMTPSGVLEYSLGYIDDYERALACHSSADEVIHEMLDRYPNQGHTSALYLGTFINFRETHRALFNPRLELLFSFLPSPMVKWFDRVAFESRQRAAN